MIQRPIISKEERIAFVLGVIILGGFFGTIIFYNLPEFWKPARVWDIRYARMISFLLVIPTVLFYPFKSKIRIWLFFIMLLLISLFITWVEELRTGPGIVANDLLTITQLTSSWAYRLFILIPIILTICSHWVSGLFLVLLIRFISNFKKNQSFSFSLAFLFTILGVLLYTLFTIGSMILIKKGHIYASVSFDLSVPTHLRDSEIGKLKEKWLAGDEILKIDTYIGKTNTDDEFAQSIFQNILLFKIEPEAFLWRGKWRNSLIDSLRILANQSPKMKFLITEESKRPQVPLEPSYSVSEVEYVLHEKAQSKLSEIGIDTIEWSETVSTKLRLASHINSLQSLKETSVFINGKILSLKDFGAFEIINIEFLTKEITDSHWVSFSSDSKTYAPGIIISLHEARMLAFGLKLTNVETIILEQLRKEKNTIEISSFENLVIAKNKDEVKIFLRDIALIEWRQINKPQGEINGKPYKIILEFN